MLKSVRSLLAIALTLVLLAGFLPLVPLPVAADDGDSIDLSGFTLPEKTGHPKLDARLNELAEQSQMRGVLTFTEESNIKMVDGMVRVIVECEPGQLTVVQANAEKAGAVIETSYHDSLQLLVAPQSLTALADDNGTRQVRLPFYFQEFTTSEGVSVINADDWHNAGYTGTGVKIGILDGGFKGYTTRQAEGELPATIYTWGNPGEGGSSESVHGTACAEIVYDIAPDATYYFAKYSTVTEMGNAVDWFITQGVDVVSDSTGHYLWGPGDGSGDACDIVNTAKAAGITWAQAIGNHAQRHWRGSFSDTDSDGYHNYSSVDETNAISVTAGYTITAYLKWNDTWGASGNDYDLLLYDQSLALVAYSDAIQDGNDNPYEGLSYTATYTGTYHLVIGKYSGSAKTLDLYSWAHNLQYQTAGYSFTIPADSAGAMPVGAVDYQTPTTIESFSSRGPTVDGRTIPALAAPDGVSTNSYSGAFYGTSAATPHAAGAAALVKQRYSSYTPAQVQSFLEGRAVELGAGGKDNVYGSGRLDLGSPTYTLTMAVSGNGTTTPTIGDHNYDPNTVVTVTAIPGDDSRFSGWTGEVADSAAITTTVTMDSSKTVTAVFDAAPDMEWNQVIGGTINDYGRSVEQTSDGGYIIAARNNDTGKDDYWLIKTDASGNQEWDVTFGGAGIDEPRSVHQTSDGGYIIAGCTDSYGAGDYDFWLVKTDASGTEEWNQTYGGASSDHAYSVRQTSDGGYVVVGVTNSYGAGGRELWLVKTDASGTKEWDRTFGGTDNDYGRDVRQTADGGYIIAGHTASYGAGGTWGDFWLIKTDSSGTQTWAQTYGTTSDEMAYALCLTSDGGYALTGMESYGGQNIWLVKTDASGNQEWAQEYGGNDNEYGYAIEQLSDGGYTIIGQTNSYGSGSNDFYLINIDADGNMLWQRTFGGSGDDQCVSGQLTSDLGYILVGSTTSYPGPGAAVWLVKVEGPQRALTIGTNGNGSTTPAAGSHDYDHGTVVNISATPAAGWAFVNWTGDVSTVADVDAASTTITMDGDYALVANFAPIYTLTMAVSGNGTTTPAPGAHDYGSGTVVNISATPDSGYRFQNWSGDVASTTSASTTVTVDADKTVTANFVANTPPVLSNGSVTPGTGDINTTFTYSVTYTDVNNDAPASPYVSIDGGANIQMTRKAGEDGDYTNGEVYEYSTSGLTGGTHTYQFSATDGDDAATGDTGQHSGPTGDNNLPTAPVVDVTPDSPTTLDDLLCTITTASTDADGDPITYSYAWYKDTVLQAALTDNTVAAANTARGEVWRCVVTPNDGIADGTTGYDEVTILNTAPTAPVVDVTPDAPVTADDIVCAVTTPSTDVDNDSITYSYAWYKDTVLQPTLTSATVTSNYTAKGEVWRCVVTPSDGTASGTADEDTVTIGNTPPTVSVTISPDPAWENSTLTANPAGVSDADSDTVTLGYQWQELNGTWQNIAGATGPAYGGSANLTPGNQYKVIVTPNDGTDDGTPAEDTITIADAPAVTITSPADGYSTTSASVTVTGNATATPALSEATITVNGVSRTIAVSSGTFSDNITLVRGANEISVSASNIAGSASDNITVTRNSVPVVTITSPANGAGFGASPITVSGTVSKDFPAVATVTVIVNGTPTAGIAVNNGAYSTAVALNEGDNTIQVSATNTAGTGNSDQITVNLNSSAPVVTINSPADGSVTTVATANVTGTVVDDPAIATATLKVNGVRRTIAISATDNISFNEQVTLVAGSNSIEVSATDSANTSVSLVTVTLDRTAPAVVISSPADNYVTSNANVTVSGTVDDSSVIQVTLAVNGADENANVSGGAFSKSVALTNGDNTIVATATDAAGNIGSSGTITVTRDNTKPYITINSPANGYVTGDATVTVSGTITCGTAVSSANITVNGVASALTVTGGSFSRQVTLTPGVNTIVIDAADSAIPANTGSSGTITVTYDTKAPVITVTHPPKGLLLGTNAVTITGTIDDEDVTTATLVLNGTSSQISVSDGAFSAAKVLANGTNTIVVRATDAVGNTGTSGTVTVEVQTGKPDVTISSPASGLVTNDATLPVSGTIAHVQAIDSANITVNGSRSTLTLYGDTTPWSFGQSVTLTEGNNTIVVSACDGASPINSGSSGVIRVTLDTTAPAVSLTSPRTGMKVSGTTVAVTGTVDDPAITTANLTVNGVSRMIAVRGGSFSYTATGLASGNNTLIVAATDRAGNTGNSGNITVTRDADAPVVTITSPSNGHRTNSAGITISGTVVDTPAITAATLTLNGSGTAITVTDGGFSENITLTAGSNVITVTANGVNTGSSGSLTVVLDTTAPDLTVSLSDPTDTVLITVSSNEALSAAPTVTINPTIDMTLVDVNEWTGTYPASGTLTAGAYTVTVNGTDRAGNSSVRTATFAKQTLTVTDNGTGQVTTGSATLQFDTSDNVTNASVSVAQHQQNPAGGSGPALDAGLFVEIVASPDLRDNLTSVYIRVDYDEDDITARGIDEASLRLYLWDVTTGQWQAVAGSTANVTGNFVYGTVTHLSEYGSFGSAPVTTTTTTTTTGGGGGGGAASSSTVTVTPLMTGFTGDTEFKINSKNGMIEGDFTVTSSDGNLTLTIMEGTTATVGGEVLSALTGDVVSPPANPSVHNIIGLCYDFGPDGAEFSPPASITVSYDPASLPAGASEAALAVGFYNTQTGEWETVPGVVDTAAHTVTAQVSHFTTFALLSSTGAAAATTPIEFGVSGLQLSPAEVVSGEPIILTVVVSNPEESAAKGIINVSLNGDVLVSEEVFLEGGVSRTLKYTLAAEGAGGYEVDVNGVTDKFTVTGPAGEYQVSQEGEGPTTVVVDNELPLSPLLIAVIAAVIGLGLGAGIGIWQRRRRL